MTPEGERLFEIVSRVVLVLFALGWGYSIFSAPARAAAIASGEVVSPTASFTSALTSPDAPKAAYVTDAALNAIANRIIDGSRGASGKLKANIQAAPAPLATDTLPPGATLQYARGGEVAAAPKGAGIWNVLLAIGNAVRPVADFNIITLLPFSAKKNGRVGLYFVGNWPSEHGATGPKKAPGAAYANPAGFIEVTQQNADTPVSEHFKLRNFLTHDQPNVWPKYLVLQQKLVDKLELVLADLQAHGVDISGVTVMSGFRTPQYNYTGGNTGGRANLSRHMFGDASDIYIDSNHDGQMDDLNHDGKITIDDSRVIEAAVDRVEAAHPELVGGAGVYTAAPGHGPFIHIDTRGYRARWSGTSGG
ncbi:MAG: hypothetical protein JWM41_127 [Gemmatimonadetes bacterium]|nr:hypothetical protein [Gemmatimonadota bacterium]